ncbi:hypothetical protein WA026_020479 [Henosepilachna vigintioctopunctata]|uniref:Uncharacterized protein n=1 Tax=Henosepilachna vigintioctopunctata TaxID=420089 RepID=A0AAW1VAT6_9CUCU
MLEHHTRKKPSQEERHMKETLDLLREAYEQNRNVNALKAFEEYKKHYLEFSQKNGRMINENRIINADNKQRATWQIINTETGKINNKYTKSTINSEVFNNFFANMGQNITKEIQTTSENSYSYLKQVNIKMPYSPLEGNHGI